MPLKLVGYEMIIAIYHLISNVCSWNNIIVKYTCAVSVVNCICHDKNPITVNFEIKLMIELRINTNPYTPSGTKVSKEINKLCSMAKLIIKRALLNYSTNISKKNQLLFWHAQYHINIPKIIYVFVFVWVNIKFAVVNKRTKKAYLITV